jgi:hypothetical protein
MPEIFTDQSLTLELEERDDGVFVRWKGKSTSRDPGLFVLPLLTRALNFGLRDQKRVVVDFRELEYMNSSTITPLIRVIEQVRRGTGSITVLYRTDLRWQSLSFSALHMFATKDGRVEVRGA